MTSEKKIVSNEKARPGLKPAKPKAKTITRTCCRQKGEIHYVTPKPLSHPSVTISLREKSYSTFIPKDEGIVARVNN